MTSFLSERINKTLSTNIRLVRMSYGMPITEAIWICEDISQSAFTAWEAGKRSPSVDSLYDFAVSFGVSLDWLCGIGDVPYDPKFVSHAESVKGVDPKFLPLFVQTQMHSYNDINKNEAMKRAKAYADTNERINSFSANARANLLVLRRYAMFMEKATDNSNIKRILQQRMGNRMQFCKQALIMVLLTGEASCFISKEETLMRNIIKPH